MQRSAHLFFTEGSSDKVYHVHLRQDGQGWGVFFENGRRGGSLREGERLRGATLKEATAVWEKTVREKIRKGYTEQESGVAFSSAALAGRDTGFRPQLLNEIGHEDAATLGDDWLVQEKHDGERRLLIQNGGEVCFANRRGLETGVAKDVDDAFRRLGEVIGGRLVLDAEDMGDHVVIFDVLEHFMIRDGSFRERTAILEHVWKTILDCGLASTLKVDVPMPASTFFATALEGLQEAGAEGYVLRHRDSLYEAGRPASGGSALKVKFWAEATCRATEGREGKRSIGLELRDGIDGPWIPVGNVTVPPGQDIPAPGSLVEVRYLYAHAGGALFQPLLKGVRRDLTEEAAVTAQLKLKRSAFEVPDPETDPDAEGTAPSP